MNERVSTRKYSGGKLVETEVLFFFQSTFNSPPRTWIQFGFPLDLLVGEQFRASFPVRLQLQQLRRRRLLLLLLLSFSLVDGQRTQGASSSSGLFLFLFLFLSLSLSLSTVTVASLVRIQNRPTNTHAKKNETECSIPFSPCENRFRTLFFLSIPNQSNRIPLSPSFSQRSAVTKNASF